MDPCRLVAYYRVSTKGQGESGLGLEGQEAAVAAYVRRTGCELIASYTEVESGKDNARPELHKALGHARRSKATLVIAKLDRLSRNAAFLGNMLESGVKFVACDNPTTTDLTIRILAAVAQEEAEKISERTKAALAAYKARGGVLGGARPECRNLTPEARKKGGKAAGEHSRKEAERCYGDILPDMVAWRKEGLTLQAIADRLNSRGIRTRNQKLWGHVQVLRLLQRSG